MDSTELYIDMIVLSFVIFQQTIFTSCASIATNPVKDARMARGAS